MGSFIGVQKVAAKKIGISLEEYISKCVLEKWCCSCKSWKAKEKFSIDRSKGDSLSSKCHECRRVKVKKSTKGRQSAFKGHRHSDETRLLISQRVREKKMTPPMLGKSHSIETRIKISNMLRQRAKKGIHSHSYKDGLLEERRGQRFSNEYKRWRFDIFSRDRFTCQHCGDNTGGNLNAHHIKRFCDFPTLRFDVNNGITLCDKCHKKEHSKRE